MGENIVDKKDLDLVFKKLRSQLANKVIPQSSRSPSLKSSDRTSPSSNNFSSLAFLFTDVLRLRD